MWRDLGRRGRGQELEPGGVGQTRSGLRGCGRCEERVGGLGLFDLMSCAGGDGLWATTQGTPGKQK